MTSKFGRFSRLLALGLVLATCAGLGVPIASGQSKGSKEYDDVVARLEEARRLVTQSERKERNLRKNISSTAALREIVETELEELAALVDAAQGRLAAAESALGKIQASLESKTAELESSLKDLEQARVTLDRRAVKLYMQGPGSVLGFVLQSRDISDLGQRIQYASRVFSSDEATIKRISKTKSRVIEERDQIAFLRGQAATQVASLASDRNRVATLRNSVESRRKTLSAQLTSFGSQLGDVQKEKEKYLRQQRELEAESARIASFLKGRNGGKATVGPGGMIWPVSGPVTSGYGNRTHPIYGTKRFHAGIDIGASSGTPIAAAASGIVISAGPKGAYGNAIIIDHGGGLATLYAHMSSIGVSGGSVKQGSTIGRVGCTGACTGPHLHFEVRVGGEPQNPLRWLP